MLVIIAAETGAEVAPDLEMASIGSNLLNCRRCVLARFD
jgi:hypothetical protein